MNGLPSYQFGRGATKYEILGGSWMPGNREIPLIGRPAASVEGGHEENGREEQIDNDYKCCCQSDGD